MNTIFQPSGFYHITSCYEFNFFLVIFTALEKVHPLPCILERKILRRSDTILSGLIKFKRHIDSDRHGSFSRPSDYTVGERELPGAEGEADRQMCVDNFVI